MDYRSEAPKVLRDFLIYHETIKGHSRATVDEYYLDLRNFFRYLKIERGLVPRSAELDEISTSDIDLDFVGSVTMSEVYDYLAFLARDKVKNEQSRSPEYGLNAASRARKISTLRSFYKYLTVKTKQLDHDPVADLDSPKINKTLPRYLTLEESERLLSSVDGINKERDYCIICLFLNCGLRISELIGLDDTDVRDDNVRVFGKGGNRIFETEEKYSGSYVGIEQTAQIRGMGKDTSYIPDKYFIPQRMLIADLEGRGEYSLLINKPISTAAQIFERYRFFPQGEIHALYWDGVGLNLKWKTRRIRGSVTNISLADFNNDGVLDLVVGLNTHPGAVGISQRKTMLMAYPLDLNMSDPNTPADAVEFLHD